MSITRSLLKGVSRGVPVGRLLLAADVTLLAGQHLRRLDAEERRRLLLLASSAARSRGELAPRERAELAMIVAKLEPRLLFGTAVRRVSPLPLPARLLYGRRGSPARRAVSRRQ